MGVGGMRYGVWCWRAHTIKCDCWCPSTSPVQVDIYHVDELYTVWGGLNRVWREGIQSYNGRGVYIVRAKYTLWKNGKQYKGMVYSIRGSYIVLMTILSS